MRVSNKLFASAIVCVASAISVTGANAGTTTTNIAVPYSTSGTIYGPGNWSGSPYNGSQIAAAPKNGNTGTGITFADWSGQFEQINPGTTSKITTSVALGTSTDVYSLLNTFYGDNLEDAVVTFTNNSGKTATFDLYGGATIRDFNQNSYQNTLTGSDVLAPGVTAENWWNNGANGQRLDLQEFILPTSFEDTTLTSISIYDTSSTGADDVLSALQVDTSTLPVSATPEPSSLVLLGSGILGLAGVMRRRLCS